MQILPSFPFIEWPNDLPEVQPGKMYMRMFVPEIGQSLAFCGSARPTIGTFLPMWVPSGELQCRYVALLASKDRSLPCLKTMKNEVSDQCKEQAQMFPSVPEPDVIVSWIRYMDMIADLIGFRPSFGELISDILLMRSALTGPMGW